MRKDENRQKNQGFLTPLFRFVSSLGGHHRRTTSKPPTTEVNHHMAHQLHILETSLKLEKQVLSPFPLSFQFFIFIQTLHLLLFVYLEKIIFFCSNFSFSFSFIVICVSLSLSLSLSVFNGCYSTSFLALNMLNPMRSHLILLFFIYKILALVVIGNFVMACCSLRTHLTAILISKCTES